MPKNDRDEDEKKIQANPVFVDEVYNSYAALCKHFGMEAKRGKQRESQKRLFNRYFDFVKAAEGNKITITDTFFDDPKPDSDGSSGIKNTDYNVPMQTLLLGHEWKDDVFLTSREILTPLRLLPPRPKQTKKAKEKETISKRDFARRMIKTLESGVHQLQVKEKSGRQDSISITSVTGTKNKYGHVKYELDEQQKEAYSDIKAEVLQEMEYASIFEVYRNQEEGKFWDLVNKQVVRKMKIKDRVYQGYVFVTKQNHTNSKEELEEERIKLCELTARRLCENYEAGYKKKDKDRGGFGLRPKRRISPEGYKENMNKVLVSISVKMIE